MDRRRQLSNVAFGGDWSETILSSEEIQAAMVVLSSAVGDCIETDPRRPEVDAALERICACTTRGPMLARAWRRAAGVREPGLRATEMHRVLRTITRVLGAQIGSQTADGRSG